ncbi:MAG: GNAT family protein [Ktedonobacteraceae bacterium]
MHIEPVRLSGRVVRLEPLTPGHATGLLQAGAELATWDYMPFNPCTSLDTMREWIRSTLQEQADGLCIPFVIITLSDERIVGSTRYMSIMYKDRGLEIGWTWLAPEVRRSAVNTECKYLLLRHAFETLGAIRVQLKTDSRNLRSQRAIERLGAVREGVLRNHKIMPDGYFRHSVYYSIIDSEWPQVKAHLETKLLPT